MQREQNIQHWLTKNLSNDEFSIHYLPGDASFRRYARILHHDKKYMLMDAPPDKEDCLPFVQIAQFLQQHGARVPQIVAQDIAQGLLLLEDFGDELLSKHLSAETVDRLYLQAFKQILQLQTIVADADIFPIYSAAKLQQEMQLFDEWLLPDLGIDLNAQEQQMLQQSYQWIIDNLGQQPQVLVHRDYHSRNLMVLADEEDLGIIDFQDAVIGPDTYDLISIIRDAYVQWPLDKVQTWVAQFYDLLPEHAKQGRDLAQFRLDVDVMSIQRHLKILGIFVRLSTRDGKTGYLKDLPLVMWYIRQELASCPALQDLAAFLEQKVMAKFHAKYGEYQAS